MHAAQPPSAPWLIAAVREAGSIALQHFDNQSFSIEEKSDGTPVTTVDKELDQFLRERIRPAAPGDGLITEEGPPIAPTSGDPSLWYVDPIDGTSHFIAGQRDFAVLVSRCRGGLSVEACLCFPGLDLLVNARAAGGCWVNRRRVHVSQRTAEGARIATYGKRLAKLHGIERPSSNSALDFVYVATGELDACVTTVSRLAGEYDYAWLPCVIEEAGGRVTDGEGNSVRFRQQPLPPVLIASNGLFHDNLVARVQAALGSDGEDSSPPDTPLE